MELAGERGKRVADGWQTPNGVGLFTISLKLLTSVEFEPTLNSCKKLKDQELFAQNKVRGQWAGGADHGVSW